MEVEAILDNVVRPYLRTECGMCHVSACVCEAPSLILSIKLKTKVNPVLAKQNSGALWRVELFQLSE